MGHIAAICRTATTKAWKLSERTWTQNLKSYSDRFGEYSAIDHNLRSPADRSDRCAKEHMGIL